MFIFSKKVVHVSKLDSVHTVYYTVSTTHYDRLSLFGKNLLAIRKRCRIISPNGQKWRLDRKLLLVGASRSFAQ